MKTLFKILAALALYVFAAVALKTAAPELSYMQQILVTMPAYFAGMFGWSATE